MSAKVVTVVGARPQFVKAAPVCVQLRQVLREVLVNTGQHYDYAMAEIFFRELGLPAPDYNLGIGSGSHGEQTGRMLAAVEQVLMQEQPDWVLVYGDTNSTLAGALAAAKLHIPVAHVEAGLRSFNRRMPEEINRVLTDHLSQLLFAPTVAAVENLAAEGITRGVHQVGDVMYDAQLAALARIDPAARRRALGLTPGEYYLLTLHRPQNVDDPATLQTLLATVAQLDLPAVFPVHPRTRARLGEAVGSAGQLCLLEPVGYLDMLALEQGARVVLTDSGGVQKEAYLLGVPCVTLREETEWVETVAVGWNTLAGSDPQRILAAVAAARQRPADPSPQFFGDGHAAERIAALMAAQ